MILLKKILVRGHYYYFLIGLLPGVWRSIVSERTGVFLAVAILVLNSKLVRHFNLDLDFGANLSQNAQPRRKYYHGLTSRD